MSDPINHPSHYTAFKCEFCGQDCEIRDYCGLKRRQVRARAYQRLTPAQRAYDDYVDPQGAYHTNFSSSCSCHIAPPCSYCVGRDDEDSAPPEPGK